MLAVAKATKKTLAGMGLGLSLSLLGATAHAGMVGDTTGFWPGDGNSNTNFVVDTFSTAAGDVEIALKAKHRFVGDLDTPKETPPGSGKFVYQADPGEPLEPGLSSWNFEWSVIFLNPQATPTDFIATLFVDFKPNDPDLANRVSFNILPPTPGIVPEPEGLPDVLAFQGSQNLGFGFWQAIPSPAVMPFDPFASGLYDFSLVLSTDGGDIGRVDMGVQVPEPGAIALFGIGLAGLGAMRRRRRA